MTEPTDDARAIAALEAMKVRAQQVHNRMGAVAAATTGAVAPPDDLFAIDHAIKALGGEVS